MGDFFEAKRRDLLVACRRARDMLIEKETKERTASATGLTLQELSRSKGVSTGVLSALQSDCVRQERQKMSQAQSLQLQWLQNCLSHQLHTAKMLEKADKMLAQEEEDNNQGAREHAETVKRKNEERKEEEERKLQEQLAQQKLEREIAKAEFERQLEALEHQKIIDAQKRKEAHLKSIADQSAKEAAEGEKERKRQIAWQKQQERLEEMKLQDEHRKAVRLHQKHEHAREALGKKEFRDERVKLSMSNLNNKLSEKYEEFRLKQSKEQEREDKLENLRLLRQEETAKKGLQTQLKRKSIKDEADRKLEERRNNLLEHQLTVEHRLMLHDLKKERYLEFKAELDGLKERDKMINVIRQKRREDQIREDWEGQARKKSEKSEMLKHEREFLWGLRKNTGAEIAKAKEDIKGLMTEMKLKSDYNVNKVEGLMKKIYKRKIFHTNFNTVQSLPDLGPSLNNATIKGSTNPLGGSSSSGGMAGIEN